MTTAPHPDTRPISWCRILAVGPPCARLCEDCTMTAQARARSIRRTAESVTTEER